MCSSDLVFFGSFSFISALICMISFLLFGGRVVTAVPRDECMHHIFVVP